MIKKRVYKSFVFISFMISRILNKIKQNKKYKTISDDIVKNEIKAYLKSNPNISKIDKEAIKEIRAKLHRIYSSYQTKKRKKRDLYLEELKQKPNEYEIQKKLLSITISTKERLLNYQNLYKQIFKITKKPKIIIDLGAGMNPLSYPLMNLKKIIYYAYDIDVEDIDFLNKYFKIMKPQGLNGKAAILDIRNLPKVSNLPQSDIIFMFKLIDLIDAKNKKISEQLIKILIKKTKFIISSFATATLSRKPMNLPKRRGFELMLERNSLKFKTIKISNEVFYIIFKKDF